MEALGIEPTLLIAQIVNFFIIVVALKVLLFKPIQTMLEKRKKEIAQGLEYTEKMRKDNEVLDTKKAAILADARKQGTALIEEAKKKAKEEEKHILAEAKSQADDIIQKGKAVVEKEREDMQISIKKESVQIGVRIAERLLSEVLSQDMQHKVLQKHLKEIEHV